MVSVDVKQHRTATFFPSLIFLMVSVDVKQHRTATFRAQELCDSRGGRPGLPVPNSPYGLCGRKATLNLHSYLGVSTAGCPDSVTFFCTAVERADYGVPKLLFTGEVPITVTSIVLVVADSLFDLCRSECP